MVMGVDEAEGCIGNDDCEGEKIKSTKTKLAILFKVKNEFSANELKYLHLYYCCPIRVLETISY